MKTLVVYASQYGNTEKVAQVIAAELKSNAVNISKFKIEMLKEVDLFIVGSPIQGWRPLPAINTMLNSLPEKSLAGKRIAAFDTRVKLFIHGDAANKINNLLKTKGAQEIIPPAYFIVKGTEGPLEEGELVRSQDWAKMIKNKLTPQVKLR